MVIASRADLMAGHYKKAVRYHNPYVIYAMSPTDVNKWYVLLRNARGENDTYLGGEYLFEILAPEDFPFKPPRFFTLTPNGLYKENKESCISIGRYHPDQYKPASGIGMFVENLIDGLLSVENDKNLSGINLLECSKAQRRDYAKNSREFNEKYYPDIINLLRESYEVYTKCWDLTNVTCDEKKILTFYDVNIKCDCVNCNPAEIETE